MGVASHTLGEATNADEIRAAISEDHPHFVEAVERMISHLGANEVDLEATPLTLGRRLELDPARESFIGDDEAAELVDRNYRRNYRVPLFI